MQISEKLSLLREKMRDKEIEACIIPSGDPHLSEYPTEHWKFREWLSNFTGSAGTLVVTKNEAGLWTDSRYWLQAETQLQSTNIQLFKDGKDDVPSFTKWLFQNLDAGMKVGIDNSLFSVDEAQKLINKFSDKNINVIEDFKPQDEIWESRPQIPKDLISIIPDHLAGFSRNEKIAMVREEMKKKDVNYYVTVSLDEIAWVLNLRGTDVSFNPIFYAYLIISNDDVKLFINAYKLSTHIEKKLIVSDIKINFYEIFKPTLKDIPDNAAVLIDPKRTNMEAFKAISNECRIIKGESIIANLKTIKNETEIENIRQTMIKDGIAMVRFLAWLNRRIDKETITELSAAHKLAEFRKEQSGYTGDAFETISAYNENGAIVHYCVKPETDKQLTTNGIYLSDSGGQYITGTTDITRTIAFGYDIPEQAKIDYTLVLKGHIALAEAIFPTGTRGTQLDILARKELWKNMLNYGHGTGHGVGYYLNVHEGPQSIRTQENPVTIKPGMLTSNEPAIYRKGQYGIRIENLILCVEKGETEFGKFLGFETLTLCPLDNKLIRKDLLSEEEIKWVNNYHKTVYEKLAPLILCESQEWLKEITQPI